MDVFSMRWYIHIIAFWSHLQDDCYWNQWCQTPQSQQHPQRKFWINWVKFVDHFCRRWHFQSCILRKQPLYKPKLYVGLMFPLFLSFSAYDVSKRMWCNFGGSSTLSQYGPLCPIKKLMLEEQGTVQDTLESKGTLIFLLSKKLQSKSYGSLDLEDPSHWTQYAGNNKDLFKWSSSIMFFLENPKRALMRFHIFCVIFPVSYQFLQSCPTRHHW